MDNSHIYGLLDDLGDLFTGDTPSTRVKSGNALGEAKRISANTSDKGYRALVAHGNVTSYSKLEILHECPRKYELDQFSAAVDVAELDREFNADFAFGHAVGAGIQTFAVTNDLNASLLAAWMAWKGDWDAEKLDKQGRPTGKSLTWACYAVEKFASFWNSTLSGYDVFRLPNGKPATEVSFAVDFENGNFHFGHIDNILIHRETKRLAVWEGKTTGFASVDEAMYANSDQALGYSVVLDAIAKQVGADATDYEVYYIVYSSSEREFQLLPFTKSRTQRAEWIQSILLDHATIDAYKRSIFPKRGSACFNSKWRRKCGYYGTCTMSTSSLYPRATIPILAADTLANVESVDFVFTLSDLLAGQE